MTQQAAAGGAAAAYKLDRLSTAYTSDRVGLPLNHGSAMLAALAYSKTKIRRGWFRNGNTEFKERRISRQGSSFTVTDDEQPDMWRPACKMTCYGTSK